MSLNTYLCLIQFDSDLQRFIDINDGEAETHEVQDISKVLWNICPSKAIKSVNQAITPSEALEVLDIISDELRTKAQRET